MCIVHNELIQSLDYEEITSNLSASVRRESLGGINYIVANASMLVPGVLNGSQGPLYYPKEEVTKNVEAWNMMPLTLGHPVINNRHVSARSPEVLEKFAIGFVFNAKDSNGKLQAEAWFDISRTQALAPLVVAKLNARQSIELSTGLYTDNHPVSNKFYRGRPYDGIARNYRPDHLAVLINAKGACSIEDGCGIAVNKSKSVESFEKSSLYKKCHYGTSHA